MANTTTKNNKKEKKDERKKSEKKATHPMVKGMRITEKSSIQADKGMYTFNVALNATKNEIKKAVKLLYKVTPIKVTIIKVAPKNVVRRGVIGEKSGGKKAVVHLKKGDKIEFV